MCKHSLIVRTIAGAAAALLVCLYAAAPVSAGTKFQANIVPPPQRYDANNAVAPGINTIAIPGQAGSPLVTGLSICVATGAPSSDNTCGGACPGNCWPVNCSGSGCNWSCAGAICAPRTCNANNTVPCASDATCNGIIPGDTCGPPPNCGPNAICVPAAAPDGVGASDAPSTGNHVVAQTSSCLSKGTQFIIKAGFDNAALTTPLVAAADKGVCQGGQAQCVANLCTKASKGTACTSDADCLCTKSADCGKDLNNAKGTCVDGNEYIATVEGTIGTSPTTSCLSGGCVIAANPGGLCIAGTCGGATIRPGQVCQTSADCVDICAAGHCVAHGNACTSAADCASGTCNGPGSTVALPTQGAAFTLGPVLAEVLCPFTFRLDFPMEVNAGKGKVIQDLSKGVLHALVPVGTNAESLGCQIREPGTTQTTSLGLYTSTAPVATSSSMGRPIPNLILPLAAGSSGNPSNNGIGAIIGTTGTQE